MSVENVNGFFKKLEQDEGFRDRLAKDERLKEKSFHSIMAVAGAEGFPFNEDDFIQAQEEMKNMELSDEELEKVAGGLGIGICAAIGYGYWLNAVGTNGLLVNKDGVALGICLGIGFN